MHRTAIRHEHNNQLLGFIYQASKGNQTYIVGIDALEKLHTGLMIPTDASMWLELKRYFGLGCLAGLKQISRPNKAQSSFVSDEYVSIMIQPLKKRKDTSVRNASKASVKVFKGFDAHLRLNPPVKVCHKMKV
jgi:hypothetical protein